MGAPCLAAAGRRDVGSSPSQTREPSATPSSSSSGSSASQFGFPKSRRLLKRAEFRRVYDNGGRLSSPAFSVFYLQRQDGDGTRVGFTAPRALGNAVIRNRIRRRMREAVRQELWRLGAPVDLIFHPRRVVLTVAFGTLRRDVVKVLGRCGTS